MAYVPTTTLVARVDAVREVGAFDERIAFGEDVDLVWRLVEAGHTVRYEPAATVTHPVRPDLSSWLRQRFDYGCSAAPLSARHPEALAPVSVSAWSAAAWTLAATGFPITGAAVAAAAAVQLPRRLGRLAHPWQESLRLAGGGTWGAWRPLSSAVTRTWWPVALGAAVSPAEPAGPWWPPPSCRRSSTGWPAIATSTRPPTSPSACSTTSPTAPASGPAASVTAPPCPSCPTSRPGPAAAPPST